MIEDLLDLLMVIYDVNDEGKKQVMESFIPRICALVIDSRVNICIQQETLKKMNAMLDKMPQDARKILFTQEMLILMNSMGKRILDAGDYDLQVGIVEALCRITTEKQRQELACQWFSMDFIANAFKGIKDSEFETDCRIFLNLVNGMLGDKRRVFTFPCLSAFLDKYELQIPSDEKLEEFWIDFNLGSQSLSFYIAGDDDDHQWEAVTVPEDKVQTYSIEERKSKKLLTVILKNILKISTREGKKLLLYFDASLEITNVTQKVFGVHKHREFIRKQGISVAKTSVHVLFDASGSQILVPESQVSPAAEELISSKEKPNSQKEFAKPQKHIQNGSQGDRKNSQPKITTPGRRKMSEASMIVTGAERYTVRSPLLLINTPTPRRGRIKPPLQMTSSAEKPGVSRTLETEADSAVPHQSKSLAGRSGGDDTEKQIKTADVVEKTENKDTEFLNQNFNEPQYIVPDSQAAGKIEKSMFPGVSYNSHGNKTPSKWACWTPVTNIKLCNKQRASLSSQGDALNQDVAINKKVTKQKPSSSLSEDNSEETGKVTYKKERMQHNKIDTAEDICRRNNEQLSQHSEQKNIENTEQSDWHIESETTFKSILLNKTVKESLIYRKKYILSEDVNTAVCDKSPSPRNNAKSHRKSRKRLMSELNAWDLKQKKTREKSKGKELTVAADSLISQINKRYKPKDGVQSTRKSKESLINSGFSNKSDLQLSKEKVQRKSYRQLKTTFVNVTSEYPLNDVYNFNMSGTDEPIIKLGIQEFQATTREACVDNSIKLVGLRNHDELEPSLKTKDKRIVRSHKKKSLFSDTDTEYRCDDNKTDVSWLAEPKPKPQLAVYGRSRGVRRRQRSGKARPLLERDQPRSKMTPKENISKKADESIPDGRARRPRRAANAKISYKELSNSESEREQEVSQAPRGRVPVKEEDTYSRGDTVMLPKSEQDALSAQTQKRASKARAGGENSLDSSPASSSSGSSPSIEVMRCVEEGTDQGFTRDHGCVPTSLSPKAKTLPPESLNSKYSVGDPIKLPRNSEKNLCARESCSPIPQSLSSETHSASPPSSSSEGGDQPGSGLRGGSAHGSGPTHHLCRKRMYIDANLSNPELRLEEDQEGTADLLPPKLTKTEDPDHKVSRSASSVSTNDSTFSGKNWGTETAAVGVMCEQFNTEFKKKFNIHQKLMDYFTKQSWKTAQQHLKTMNHHIQEYRIQKLDKFQLNIIEELKNFEKDSQTLKDLEKEFADFWEKTVQKLIAYQQNEQERLHLLKASLDANVFYSSDREEAVRASEMCFMKENMKILQDRLLKEMQEEELLNVRRGLLSLFMAREADADMDI
ncbi:synaptonemal complex protein 2 [Phyllostomus discolor]|uniref:Synaptonemal complex protein 2 n=1 Tax=Phyllostomus discolor TaxID=89673 RepID=A0A834DTH6_9CHIR|nr:synaptonemal complex protein 2 [Phyllostomus discolor]